MRTASKLSQNGWALSSQQSGVSADTFLDKTKNDGSKSKHSKILQNIQKLHLGKAMNNSDIAGLSQPEDPEMNERTVKGANKAKRQGGKVESTAPHDT